MSHPKVQAHHLHRKAVISIRQSSLQQVIDHRESQRRQYQLVELATSLGWSESACKIIDDDQARSAAQSYNRPGYQRLTAMVALREIGLIIGIDVSRLARNCLDWYELLQLAALFDVLVADEEGLYDLSQFNDRLLLGLKGIFAEAELHQIQARMVVARLSKAERGELRFRLPVGLEWDELTGKPRLTTNQAVRHAVALVFRLFPQLRSIRAVLQYLRREGVDLPSQRRERGGGSQITWRQPTTDALRALLSNPLYAGVYCYGRKHVLLDPRRRVIQRRQRPRAEWRAVLPAHHPGYLTLEQFEHNQQLMANNAYRFPGRQGAARTGRALARGLVLCAHCGRKMHVRSSHEQVRSVCDLAHLRYGDPVCNRATARHVDGIITHLFLQLVNANALEVALSFQEKLQQEASQIDHVWQHKISRLEYEANLARRRDEAVDPENRLVAQTLETEWNQRLQALAEAHQTHRAQRPTSEQLTRTLEEMRTVLTHLRDYWLAPSMSSQDKKELVRCVVQQVVVDGRNEVIRVQLHWYGGSVSEVAVPKRLQTPAIVSLRIQELARTETDHAIAERLNAEGDTTGYQRAWSDRYVRAFRHAHAIPSAFDSDPLARCEQTRDITTHEAAQRLGLKTDTINEWCQLGLLPSRQPGPNKRVWIHWTADLEYRLGGLATPLPGMVAVRELCQLRGQHRSQVLAWAVERQLPIYRLQHGALKPFYILLPTVADPQT